MIKIGVKMKNERVECVSSSTENFWHAVKIYYNHPNSINKQVLLSEHLFGGQLQPSQTLLKIYNTVSDNLNSIIGNCENFKKSEFFLTSNDTIDEAIRHSTGTYLFIRRLVPKRSIENQDFLEIIFLEKVKTQITIYTKHRQIRTENDISLTKDPLSILKFSYIKLQFNLNSLKLQYNEGLGDKGVTWLSVIFMPKFINIMKNDSIRNIEDSKLQNNKILSFSNMVNVVEYYKLYEEMKSKYAEFLIKNWTENTDPKKYVYEDIGIATYLLLLWQTDDKTRKQRFIDLGCGNGLLVHILNAEGHLGIGFDMRRRKIWDTYDKKTILKEEIINPIENTKYSEVDWLIGNHSDELTPWIPIMTRRNNPHCQYFVLPCCPYQLNGQKFQRKNSGISSYKDFINHLKEISDMCNFETHIDRLRIPSTKRICVIGLKNQVLTVEKEKEIDNAVEMFIIRNCASRGRQESESLVFKVRDSVEKVRNCTKLQKDVIDTVLRKVMAVLLEKECLIELTKDNVPHTWNRGEKVAINTLAQRIDSDLLKRLKNECKGLQTLLKNHHYIFEVKQGAVQFRDPRDLEKLSSSMFHQNDKSKWKNRKCWFNDNHPNGCPLSDDKCSYRHNETNSNRI